MSSKEYQRAWYQANKERRMPILVAQAKARKIAIRERVRELKEASPCLDCKQFYPWYVMEFDHVRGAKTEEISEAVGNGWCWERLQTEIDKCELVCSNCHRARTYERRTLAQTEERSVEARERGGSTPPSPAQSRVV